MPGNNWIENRIRPIALGRNNWLFAGSLRAGQRAAAIMSVIGSAKLNDLDPYAYLSDVLERLPMPRFAKRSVRDVAKEKIAPVHPDFACETSSLSLMGSAGRRPNRIRALWVLRPARAVPTTV